MPATADQVMRLRRMTGEMTSNAYSDAQLKGYIESYPLVDVNGRQYYLEPQYVTGALPNTKVNVMLNPVWIPTFDLNSAAADIWQEKATAYTGDFDFSADGGSFSRSQVYEHAMQQARYYRGRRAPGCVRVTVWPNPANATTIMDDLIDLDDRN
jgi:hypothetical protein